MAKKTLDEKADEFIDKNLGVTMVGGFAPELKAALILLLKEQDRDTRHACAELIAETRSVALPTETMGRIDMIVKDAAHNAIMNCRGGIE